MQNSLIACHLQQLDIDLWIDCSVISRVSEHSCRDLCTTHTKEEAIKWELWAGQKQKLGVVETKWFIQPVLFFFYDEKDLKKKQILKSQRSAILSNFLLFAKDYYFFIVYIKITI